MLYVEARIPDLANSPVHVPRRAPQPELGNARQNPMDLPHAS